MSKVIWKGGTLLGPIPAALVSCGSGEHHNIITVAWTGIINSDPPRTYVSIKPERFSHGLIKESGEFVINLPTAAIARKVDLCGVRSGRDVDKFSQFGLTAKPSANVSAPTVDECPLALECRVFDVLHLGSHDMFLADILSVSVEEGLIDEGGKLHLERAGLLAFAHGQYYNLGRRINNLGFSVRKKPARRPQNRRRG